MEGVMKWEKRYDLGVKSQYGRGRLRLALFVSHALDPEPVVEEVNVLGIYL